MPGWIKYLPKHKDWGLDPQNPCKSSTSSAVACHPSTQEAETGYPRQGWLVDLGSARDPTLVNEMESDQEKHAASTWGLHMYIYTTHTLRPHTYEHTCTYMHTTHIYRRMRRRKRKRRDLNGPQQ